jgi:hypothetical protein
MGLSIELIHEDISKLLTDCQKILAGCNEDQLRGILNELHLSWDQLYQIVEMYTTLTRHVLENTYDMVFFKLGLKMQDEDLQFQKVMSSCHNLTLHHLSVPLRYGQNLPLAIKGFLC